MKAVIVDRLATIIDPLSDIWGKQGGMNLNFFTERRIRNERKTS